MDRTCSAYHTTVCKHWRSITLRNPAFWSIIPLKHCRHLAEMLSRSKTYPRSMRLHISRNSPGSNWLSDSLEQHLPNILDPMRLLDFHVKHETRELDSPLHRCLQQYFPTHTTPFLQSLKLLFVALTAVPAHVLSSNKPALRHLHLDHVEVDWSGLDPSITNLITLELVSIMPAPPQQIIHGIISSSPNLKILQLSRCFPTFAHNTLDKALGKDHTLAPRIVYDHRPIRNSFCRV